MLNIDPPTFISRLIILVIALTVHELAHAWVADWFGDDTPRRNGRLTLNPIAHLDPIGSLMFLVVGFGWAKPVPVNPFALQRRSPSALMWVALAGPLSNLGLALLGAIPFKLNLIATPSIGGLILPNLSQLLLEFIFLNLVLLLFNLIPIFPLDGEKVLTYLAPRSWGATLDQLRSYGPLILIAVIFLGQFLPVDILNLLVWQPALTMLSFLIGPGLGFL